LQRAFDQIIHDVALQNLGVVFAVDRGGVVGEDGPTHHGMFDLGYLRLIPNLVCMAPKDKEELEDMLEFAFTISSPVSIRYPKGQAYSLGNREPVKLGKSQVISEGEGVCLLALGSMVKPAAGSLSILKEDGINAGLVNARFIKPLDEDLLKELPRKFNLIVTLEEGSLDCGFGSAVLEFYEKAGIFRKVRVVRIGFPNQFIPGAGRDKLLNVYGLSGPSLAKKINKLLKEDAYA
jgi:1-deoxy-D-xylulose-5-phosphate synthase